MKYFYTPFIILFILILQGCQAKISSTEQLSKKIFKALKEEDFEQLINLAPDESTLTSFYQQYAEQEDRAIKFDLKEMPNLVKILHEGLKRSYNKIQKNAKEKEIDWKKAKFFASEEAIEKDDFTEGATVVFIFDSGKEKLNIVYRAIKVKGSWYLVEGLATSAWVFKNDLMLEEE